MQIKKLKRDQVVEVHCKELVPEGFGLVHIEFAGAAETLKPLTGFVWGILPGEIGLARVARAKKGHFHGVLLKKAQLPEEILGDLETNQLVHEEWALYEVSSARIKQRCDNFTLCGGCKLQHLTYEDSIKQKLKWFQTHLDFNKVGFEEIHIVKSPRLDHYRNHVQVHINKHKHRGFYAPFSYRTVQFPEHGCLLFDQKTFDENFPEEFVLERCVRSRHDYVDHNIGHWSLYSVEDKQSNFTYVIEYPPEEKISVTIANTAFFQVNTAILPKWLGTLQNLISKYAPGERCLELFSGFGFISHFLATQIDIESTGVDILKPSDLAKTVLQSSNEQLAKKLLSSVEGFNERYIQADLTHEEKIDVLKKDALNQVDYIIMNPPRSGFGKCQYFFENIMKEKPPIFYSSCNSATFSRDAATLEGFGYQMVETYLFDFFPFTSHFEVVAAFVAKNTN